MNENNLFWQVFEDTGLVEAYLIYKKEEENNQAIQNETETGKEFSGFASY